MGRPKVSFNDFSARVAFAAMGERKFISIDRGYLKKKFGTVKFKAAKREPE